MLLAIDIGNTRIALGVFNDKELIKRWQFRAEKEKTCDEYQVTLMNLFSFSDLDISGIKGVIISSVVPPLNPVFQKLIQRLFQVRALEVSPGIKTGMPILYDNPHEVGADRIALAVAARQHYGSPCIVVDFGTATTFDAVSSKGEYLGGAIAPGIQISAEALYQKTAKLPRIDIQKIKKAIGKSTVASMHSGLYFGYIGLVSKIIEEMKNELGGDAQVIGTGGFASLIFDEMECIDHHDSDLVLKGLLMIYHINKMKRQKETNKKK
ncbi:MAG: type III pantothenate kinase [Candidatus Aminicenantes bacterium]|nr:type III pantothenate kinase [Candidatus Aminicenantes bacterium]